MVLEERVRGPVHRHGDFAGGGVFLEDDRQRGMRMIHRGCTLDATQSCRQRLARGEYSAAVEHLAPQEEEISNCISTVHIGLYMYLPTGIMCVERTDASPFNSNIARDDLALFVRISQCEYSTYDYRNDHPSYYNGSYGSSTTLLSNALLYGLLSRLCQRGENSSACLVPAMAGF